MNTLIEPIEEYDRDSVIEFIKCNAQDAFPNNQLPTVLLRSINSQTENCITNGKCFKTSINHKHVGVIISSGLEGGVSTIIWLLVDPRHRGLGIGLELINFFIGLQKDLGAHKIKLTVASKEAMNFI